MELSPYVASLREDLLAALKAAAPDLGDLSDRLGAALDPALRLALMEVLSEAAAEITRDLPAGEVQVRLNGREPELVLDLPEAETPSDVEAVEEDDEAAVARITLRLPDSVKARIEELAGEAGTSVNTWVVNTLRKATRDDGFTVDLGPFFGRGGRRGPGGPGGPGGPAGRGQRMNGWI